MDPRLSLVTLAVADLPAVRRFYVDGLGWEPTIEEPGEVIMFQVADRVLLSLWDERQFEEEVAPIARGAGVAPITLAHNCASKEEVDRVLADADAAGAHSVRAAVNREWGGYSGYFADPEGYRWEVAWAPGAVGEIVLP